MNINRYKQTGLSLLLLVCIHNAYARPNCDSSRSDAEAEGYNVIIGTDRADEITGTNGKDFIKGRGGNDFIKGEGGNDVICGGKGDDWIYGGDGYDYLYGEKGNDFISFDDDTPDTSGGKAWGGDGHDHIIGGRGESEIYGEYGDDSLWGSDDGSGYISGGPDNDFIWASVDTEIEGDSGHDLLGGGKIVFGGSGNDVFNVAAAQESTGTEFTFEGGSGADRAIGSVNHTNNLYGGSGNDELDGGNVHDYINGGSGMDVLRGGGGNDTLVGGSDLDYIYGGSGTDTCNGDFLFVFECER